MSQVDFILTYDGPALKQHEMNVRDLAPAMLAVGEAFEALNALYNGKAAQLSVNVRAHQPACFKVAFDVVQVAKDATAFLSGTEVTAAVNLLTLLFGGSLGGGLIWLIRKLKGRKPERIERLSPGLFRLFIDDETYDIPVELLQAYQEVRVRRAIEGFVAKPLQKPGIEEVIFESGGQVIEHVSKAEAPYYHAPDLDSDVVVDDVRRAAYTIRDLSFDEDGTWKLFDGANPIKVRFEDREFLERVGNDEIRFAAHDVLVCSVHFVQRRTGKGLANDYTVVEVLEHIAAPRQLKFPEIQEHDPDEDEGPSHIDPQGEIE